MASNRKSKRGEELTKNNEPSTLKMQESPPASTQTSLSPLVIRPSLQQNRRRRRNENIYHSQMTGLKLWALLLLLLAPGPSSACRAEPTQAVLLECTHLKCIGEKKVE